MGGRQVQLTAQLEVFRRERTLAVALVCLAS